MSDTRVSSSLKCELEDTDCWGTVTEVENKLEDFKDEEASAAVATPKSTDVKDDSLLSEDSAMDASFMSESIYQKLPSPRSVRHKSSSQLLQKLSWCGEQSLT